MGGMKAWVLRKPGPLEGNPLKLVRLKLPVPVPGEVLIEVAAARVPVKTDVEIFAFNDAPLALKMLKESKINGAAALSMA